jgi:ectoine hydroxylase-related dioxygenase (phytanoyl-CoA dioxygenase family)
MQAAQADGVQVRHAQLAAGDALVFGPALVHRTHVTPAMTRRRISVDLRFTDRPLPPRMRHERLLNLHA